MNTPPEWTSETTQEAFKALTQSIPMALIAMMQDFKTCFLNLYEWLVASEVERYCGKFRRRRTKAYQRWGTNPGSIAFGSERIRVRVPRVRNLETGKEQPLKTYTALHKKQHRDAEKISMSVLLGLSQRKYKQVVRQFTTSFGLSASTVGRLFIERTARWLEAFEQRTLGNQEFVALLIDGKYLRQQQMILCVGLTTKGEKRVLALTESETENAAAIEGLLRNLLQRGFRHTKRLLIIIDGAKGITKGVRQVFGDTALIQRCQWHKRENVAGKTRNKAAAEQVRTRMNEAYAAPTYAQAKRALHTLEQDLEAEGHTRAAASLREGLEETLTLHRLDVQAPLRDSLRTTNIIESVNSLIAHHARNVKRWSNTDQRHRWMASICMVIEPQLTPIRQCDQWQKLVTKLAGEPAHKSAISYLPHPTLPALGN